MGKTGPELTERRDRAAQQSTSASARDSGVLVACAADSPDRGREIDAARTKAGRHMKEFQDLRLGLVVGVAAVNNQDLAAIAIDAGRTDRQIEKPVAIHITARQRRA